MKFLDSTDGWPDSAAERRRCSTRASLSRRVSYEELLMFRNFGQGNSKKVSDSLGPISSAHRGRGLARCRYANDATSTSLP